VPIVPELDEHGKPLDLSLSMLRAVSPIHIEYLRNMGVRASMSISIIVDGKLWGLFACHHYSPRCPAFERRSVAELFAQMFAMRLESRERQETVEYERRARDISDQLLGAVASDETLLNDPDWLVLLNPQAYSTMALVVHELVTNSAKYGSLSDSGQVSISWRRSNNGDLLIDWTESGGPPASPPTRKGFGSTIVDRSIPYDLGGEAEMRYEPGGVEASFRIPARHVSEAKDYSGPTIRFTQAAKPVSRDKPPQVVDGKTVLLVEDSLIIALDAEDILRRLGARHVITAGTVEYALEAIDRGKPSLALLDINLGHQNSFPIAGGLLERDIPFLFATGYGEQAQLPAEHRQRLVVQKPYTLENLARAIPKLAVVSEEA